MRNQKKATPNKNTLFSKLKTVNNELRLSKEDVEALSTSTQKISNTRSKSEVLQILINLGKHIKKGGTISEFASKNNINARRLREYREDFRNNPQKYIKGN